MIRLIGGPVDGAELDDKYNGFVKVVVPHWPARVGADRYDGIVYLKHADREYRYSAGETWQYNQTVQGV